MFVLTLFSCFFFETLQFEENTLSMKLISYVHTSNRLIDGSCCETSEADNSCQKSCNLIWRACLLPRCSFSPFLKVEKFAQDVVNLEMKGENNVLIQVWNLDVTAYKMKSPTAFQLVKEIDIRVLLTSNWKELHIEKDGDHMILNTRFSCTSCHQATARIGGLDILSKKTLYLFNNLQSFFTKFVNKVSGFSYRLSNILNLLDVMKRILTTIF